MLVHVFLVSRLSLCLQLIMCKEVKGQTKGRGGGGGGCSREGGGGGKSKSGVRC